MELKTVKEILNRSEYLKAERAEQLQSIQKEITEAEKQIDQLKKKAEKAKEKRKQSEFMTASEEIQKLDMKMKTLQEWEQSLQEQPMITDQEYKALSAAALEEIRENAEAMKADLIREAETLFSKGNELLKAITETDTALHTLQNDLYKNQDRRKYGSAGTFVSADELRTDPALWRIAEWSRLMALNYQYKEYTGHLAEIVK